MTKFHLAQTSFHRGEQSPLMASRFDKSFVSNGAESLLNMAPLAQGGVRTRPGSLYLTTLGSTYGVGIDFVFSPTQRYFLFARTGAIDILSTTGSLLNTLTLSALTSGMITDGKLTWDQSYDTMILCHEDLKTQKIIRTGTTTFTIADITFKSQTTGAVAGYPVWQPFYKYAASSVTINATATTAGSTATLTTSDSYFTTNQVNDLIRIGGKQVLITATTGATVATGQIKEALSSTNTTDDWDEQAWSTYRGWPISTTFFPDRLVFWGAKSRPSGLWLSKIGDYYNFNVGSAADDDAIWEGVAGARAKYVVGSRFLTLFGDRDFYHVPTSASNPLTPANFSVVKQQPYGCAQVKPQLFDEAFLFIQHTGSVVREALWEDVLQQYSANPVSLLSPHLVTGGSTYSAPTALSVLYGRTGFSEQYALLLTSSGQISCFHSVREEKLAAWTPWQTSGTVKGMVALDTEIFFTVERALSTGTVLTLEKFTDTGAALDCQMAIASASTAATSTFSGASVFASKDVHIVHQGHYLGSTTVATTGTVTLPTLAPNTTGINIGYKFTQEIEPMPAAFDMPDGTSKGRILGMTRAFIQVDSSHGFTVSGTDVYLDQAGDAYSSAAPTKTGIVEVNFLGYDTDAQFTINVTNPAKITVLGVTREIEVNE